MANEQISFIDRAESFIPSAFSFAQNEIDHFLLLGSNTDEKQDEAKSSTEENAELLAKLLTNPETAALLKALAKSL